MSILFDTRDHQLLSIVNDALTRDKTRERVRKIVYPFLHPHGIKEMSETRGLRIAHATIHLLQSLEAGEVDDRLNALRSLRDEVIDTAAGSLPKNTARVLLQIMKELVRAHGDYQKQLRLAHDFRTAAAGNPRLIRKQLRRFHLLEMPEAWNQMTFDDHVHDANTKGRKTSSHLILDAWIKGIRRLRVIYYNYLEPRFVVELSEAANIMGITVRIGAEFNVRFRDKYAQIMWVPRGFRDSQAFLCFLAEEPVAAFMSEGKKVSEYQQRYVMAMLEEFNKTHRRDMETRFGLELAPIEPGEFLSFVGMGQASIVHLAEFIHSKTLLAIKQDLPVLRERHRFAAPEERLEMERLVDQMNRMDSESIIESYLEPEKNPGIPDPSVPPPDPSDHPELPTHLTFSARDLLGTLAKLHSAYRTTLNLTNLKVEDVLELLYDTEGMITRLEIFNLKDYAAGKVGHIPEVYTLQAAINEGNVVHLKRIINGLLKQLSESDFPDEDRMEKLKTILHDISSLKDFYLGTPLKARIGSDSTGRARRVLGMGLAVKDTLPSRARREIDRPSGPRRVVIPFSIGAFRRKTYIPRSSSTPMTKRLYAAMGRVPGLRRLTETCLEDWYFQEYSLRMGTPGNIVTLGGAQKEIDNLLFLHPPKATRERKDLSWKYLHSGVKNGLKIVLGFVPAFLTFYLTKDWWVLAYLGAFIWFGITGLRNILQSVLGGGGIRRSPLLRWNDYISWERIADSLLYTGFSVPLLDYFVKTLLLDRGMGVTIATDPFMLYTVMAVVNGLYLSTHNALRGLPRGAIFGNLFRTILSIPIAILFNAAAGLALTFAGAGGVDVILQKWAAIISKAASDLVAGIIEGTADRYNNIRMRWRDYRTKLTQVFDVYARLELLFPDSDVLALLSSPQNLRKRVSAEIRDIEQIVMINALDLLYFWMYQPRARTVMKAVFRNLSEEEREILIRSQSILLEERNISLMFIDGLVGRNFSRALSFYLERSKEYLCAISRLDGSKSHPPEARELPLKTISGNSTKRTSTLEPAK
jgi:hypothetical protein